MHYVILRKVELSALEIRWIRGDLIEVFKILKVSEDKDKNLIFNASSTSTKLRGHSEKLYHRGIVEDMKYFR